MPRQEDDLSVSEIDHDHGGDTDPGTGHCHPPSPCQDNEDLFKHEF